MRKGLEMKSIEELAVEYQRFIEWRENNPDKHYIIFRQDLRRFIVVKGIELYDFFGDVMILTISGEEQLHEPIRCNSADEARRRAYQMNYEYVKQNEPDIFENFWKDKQQ